MKQKLQSPRLICIALSCITTLLFARVNIAPFPDLVNSALQVQSIFKNAETTKGIEINPPILPKYNPTQGFRHPGILHTQEDFDRVKALLAANDPTIIAAYNRLKSNSFSSSTYTPNPQTSCIRGGSDPQTCNQAMRDAAAAYQNALRWKISGDDAHAKKAIAILNSWATLCKIVSGDTNQSLGSGLYGYEFANAAELMRDYEGWKPTDFKKFQEWMLTLWYPRCIDFLRRRHDTWSQGTPGHYWSNWGLCNTLAVMSIGILCDDIFIYNQGVSFYKYDQVGNFTDNRVPPIDNSGLTEFIGNLVPAVHEDARGPFGYLGQMQESGRDQGHALMALGLAVDICQVGWNQGDDLFSFMDNRLAAGIEYVAACNATSESLPWSEYWYHDVRTSIYNSWKMTENNEGGRGAFRPYWDRILGHYEGVKGISMTYSHAMKNKESIDNGAGSYGTNSGGFDHLGFSTLMCYRPAITVDKAPTQIIPTLIYKDIIYKQNELGGLVNRFEAAPTSAIPVGGIIKFIPTLPAGTTDTGNWQWDTGATTKDLEITANESGLYRVTYTNERGIKSTQLYSIAVKGSCLPETLTPTITMNGVTVNDTIISVMSGASLTLEARNKSGWGYYQWNNGSTASSISISGIRSDRTYRVTYTNQGGKETIQNFHIHIGFMFPSLSINGGAVQNTNTVVVNRGQSVELIPIIPKGKENGIWKWSDGTTTQNLRIENVQNTAHYSVSYQYNNEEHTLDFDVYVTAVNKLFTNGTYYIKNASNGQYLTNDGSTSIPIFHEKAVNEPESQIWTITKDGTRYKIVSKLDNRFLNEFALFSTNPYYAAWNSYTLYGVESGDLYAIQNGGSAGTDYWAINSNGSISGKGGTSLNGYPFEIISTRTVDLPEISEENLPMIYPNPMQDYLIIYLEENRSDVSFNLYSIDGIAVKTISCTSGRNSIQVNDLPNGMYLGILNMNGQKKTIKIIKK